ncbi:MAG: guanylate kinase [Gammaproteobacteria bacterium]|nr:guanylate kinase [Gammaproteobacteria bacterium]|tara:strand:- start:15 stop:638 length:624 start_codon:yes stop_codon:yes gene_type:complete
MVDFDNSIFKKLCVVSAPSGAGKTSLIKKILKDKNISVCISDTSRKPRVGEANGIDYNFISSDEFQDKIKNEKYLEHAMVHGNFYGTLIDSVVKLLEDDIIVILEIDFQGAEIIKKKFPLSRSIFILPPSFEILEKRLRERGTDEEEIIIERLENAKIELSKAKNYDYIIVNDDFAEAEKKLHSFCMDKDLLFDDKIRKEPLIHFDF